jgi:hypothetical protein
LILFEESDFGNGKITIWGIIEGKEGMIWCCLGTSKVSMKKKRRESSHQNSRVNTVDYFLERHLIGDTNDRSYDLRPPSQRQAKGTTPPPWGSFWGKKMNETL